MTKLNEVYRCNKCRNIVKVLHIGGGTLVCCGQDMELLKVNSVNAAQEKHIPVVEETENGIKVKVGSVDHPMTEEHYIEWIEVQADGKTCIKYLNLGDAPEAEFSITGQVTARAYCNLHGLWKN